MREIKFRAWNKETKTLITDVHRWSTFNFMCMGDERYDIMQYTGLRDKQGTEIYEGDIVSIQDYYFGDTLIKGENSVIRWDDGSFEYYSENDGGELDSAAIHNYQIKVIGNIYENPELLMAKEK